MRVSSSLILAAAFAAAAAAVPARAADDVSLADLKAATRSLGFLQYHSGGFVIGIVYAPNGKNLSQQTAERIRTLPGPNNSGFKAETVAVGELAGSSEHLDALYLVPGTTGNASAIADIARRRHLLVMSNDPACLDQHCCMLMVRDNGRVEIVLDSELAQAAGVSFSSVFAMMVKHK